MKSNLNTAEEAKSKLIAGNEAYTAANKSEINASEKVLIHAAQHGQKPYAVIVTCSDSRVIPESVFSAGIGDLFVIRVAGNVIGDHQLGSIAYAAEHLGTKLVVVLGHTHCGAVDAAMHHAPDGYIKSITDKIVRAIGSEADAFKACCQNVRHSCSVIQNSLQIPELQVRGAVYHLETGRVEFL